MYEELYEPLPQTEPYLKRLGLDTVPAADKKNLDRLIYAHQLHAVSYTHLTLPTTPYV